MDIEVNQNFTAGYYGSSTDNNGWYRIYNKRRFEEVILSSNNDFHINLNGFFDRSCPLVSPPKRILVLFPLKVETGTIESQSIVGRASQFINVSGTVQVSDSFDGKVHLSAMCLFDGFAKTEPIPNLPPPLAEIKMKFSVEGLGKLGQSVSTKGSQTQTVNYNGSVGLKAAFSSAPVEANLGLGAGYTKEVQSEPYGVLAVNDNLSGSVPVNKPLNWSLTMSLFSKNDENIALFTKAKVLLKRSFIQFTLLPGVKNGPIFSPTRSVYYGRKYKAIAPNAPFDKPYGSHYTEDEILRIMNSLEGDKNFLPKLRYTTQSGEFIENDKLLGSSMRFSGIELQRMDPSRKKAYFSPGILEFLSPQDPDLVLLQASVTEIIADAKEKTFHGLVQLMNTEKSIISHSPFAQALDHRPARITLDPEIMEATNFFSQDAVMDNPYFMMIDFSHPEIEPLLALKATHEIRSDKPLVALQQNEQTERKLKA